MNGGLPLLIVLSLGVAQRSPHNTEWDYKAEGERNYSQNNY